MTLALPPSWPPCGAPNTDARRTRPHCRARGDGWGGRCRHHGGLDVPEGFAVVVSPGGIFAWRRLRATLLDPDESARQRVGWRIAALMIQTGRVERGFFFGKKGSSLLRELKTAGVDVRAFGGIARTALGLTQYAFRRREAA